jgi:hypothetical protein
LKHAYVYYRVVQTAARPAAERADARLAHLAGHCATTPRRLARCDDALTWMEIYEGIADWDAFLAAMNASLGAAPFAPHIDGERHLECFAGPLGTAHAAPPSPTPSPF